MSAAKVEELFGYVQERCLWQFFSRSWDRQENIDGILAATQALLTGGTPKRDTPMDRLFHADATAMAADLCARFPWLATSTSDELTPLFSALNDKLVEFTITKSLNRELTHTLY
jgi:vanadium nitrogenase delta subunit